MEILPGTLGAESDRCASAVASWAARPQHHGRWRPFQDGRRRHSGQGNGRELHW